jgi:hypothetical protein
LFAEIVGIWQKRYKLLASDYAVTRWLLSVRPDIKSDASSNVKSHHKECVDRVIEKLYFNKTVEEQMETKNTFWKEWNQFRCKMGPVFGQSYIWEGDHEVQVGKSHIWHWNWSHCDTEVLGAVAC